MMQFHPPGFGQKAIATSLGSMTYYTQVAAPWLFSSERPQLVFLHCFGGGASAYEWSKVYPAFASEYRILAADLIGWGESAHPVWEYQIADYLTTLAEFLQTCHPPVKVVASSLTAALIIRLAIQHPELFQSLFLICPSGFDDFGEGIGRRLPLQLISTPFIDRLIYALGAENEISVRNFLQQFLFAKPERVTSEMIAAYLASAQKPNAEYAALAFLKADLYFDLALYVPQLTVPTVILWGEQAQFTKIDLGRRLAKLNPRSIIAFETIPHAGVLPHLETPEIAIGVLQKYLMRSEE